MADSNKESVERTIREKNWYKSEREIQHGHQFTLTDGTKINCFNTGKVQVHITRPMVMGRARVTNILKYLS